MVKKYKGYEITKAIYDGELKANDKLIDSYKREYNINFTNGVILNCDGCNYDNILSTDEVLTKIECVNFIEVLKSNRLAIIVNDDIKSKVYECMSNYNDLLKNIAYKVINDEYSYPDDVLHLLSFIYNGGELYDILNEENFLIIN